MLAGAEAAIARGLALVDEGADWIDVGGESTRPGAQPVGEVEERARVLPVIEGLAKRSDTPISIDTRRASVADAALARGAQIVNAVTGLRDPELAAVCAAHRAILILNHIRGEPATMQREPVYDDVVREVRDELLAEAALAERAGVARGRIWLDPGLGFGKHPIAHNLPLLAELETLVATGYPVMVGASRKSFVGALTGAPVDARLPGSLAAATAAVLAGARAIRAHDVAATRQAVDLASAIRAARRTAPP
jgi:dihydropteroate synthase